ncbi:Kelch repeat-containing protein [Rufibacter latericius]|nr:kelch repeat-containing protein [Rufibacter latericius]
MKSTLKLSIVALLLAILPFASCTEDDEGTGPDTTLKADAGPDQTITPPPNSVGLNGSNSTSLDSYIVGYEWTKAYGPDTFRIADGKSASVFVDRLVPGTYGFALTVRDAAGRVDSDTVQVTVNPGFIDVECDSTGRPLVNARLVPIGTLSEARAMMAGVAVGTKVLFAGAAWSNASANGQGSSRVDIFDAATGRWSTARLSQARSAIATVAAGDKVFFAGGRLHGGGTGDSDVNFSTVDIYDAATGSWSVASLSEPRAYVAAAALGDKVFFAGGERGGDFLPSARVDIYDLSTGQWSAVSLSEPRRLVTAVAAGEKVFFAGGHKDDIWEPTLSNRVDVYDGATGTWSTTSLNYTLGHLAGLAVGDDVYWLAGCAMERVNANTGETSFGRLFQPTLSVIWFMNNHAVVKDNKLLFFRDAGEDAHRFDIYDLGTRTWSIGMLPQDAIQYKTIVAAGNEVYLAGGATLGDNLLSLSNQVWRLEF